MIDAMADTLDGNKFITERELERRRETVRKFEGIYAGLNDSIRGETNRLEFEMTSPVDKEKYRDASNQEILANTQKMRIEQDEKLDQILEVTEVLHYQGTSIGDEV